MFYFFLISSIVTSFSNASPVRSHMDILNYCGLGRSNLTCRINLTCRPVFELKIDTKLEQLSENMPFSAFLTASNSWLAYSTAEY